MTTPFGAGREGVGVAPPRQVQPAAKRGGLARVGDYLRLVAGLMRDGDVSLIDRALVVLSIAYVIFPFDFIPDVIPFVGEVDDVVLVMMALTRLFEHAPGEAIVRHWRGAPGELSTKWLRRVAWGVSFLFPSATRRRLRQFARGAALETGYP